MMSKLSSQHRLDALKMGEQRCQLSRQSNFAQTKNACQAISSRHYQSFFEWRFLPYGHP